MPDFVGAAAEPAADPRSIASGIRMRILVPLGLGLLALIASFVVMLVTAQGKRNAADIKDTAAAVQVILAERTALRLQVMRSVMEPVMGDPRFQAAMRKRDRKALLELSLPLLDGIRARNDISHFYYILPDRTALLRVHAPGDDGDKINRFVLQEAQRTGKPFWGNEQGPLGSFTLRLVYPWMVKGELLGYLEMGVEFEHLVEGLRKALKADVFVALDKTNFDGSKWQAVQQHKPDPLAWDEFPGVIVLSRTTSVIPAPLRAYLAEPAGSHQERNFEIKWDGRAAQIIAMPFPNLRGQRVGELVVMRDITAAAQLRSRVVATIVLVDAAIGGSLILLFHVLLGRVQRDVAARTERLNEARRVLASEQDERQRAERELVVQNERNALLEARSRIVEELAEAKRVAEAALEHNEEITAKLRETQSELLAIAHQSGRAEMATNVLHNVGNVLNSVNVSAGLIGSAVRKSRVPSLSRALQLMDERAGDLGDFLTHDAKGRMLPDYLNAVGRALVQEQAGVVEELERLTKSIDHIKEIVTTQQSHAAGAGVVEPVLASDLAEDALRMQGSSLTRHQVTVIREYQPVPLVPLERGRVLQILVNLISNAKQAMAGRGENARLTLRVEMAGSSRLRIIVRDEGEGIEQHNLTRIFAHGFTTRKSGHGFGLHSSALAARQMGGTLTADSDGPGKGAVFTLELPIGVVPVA
ncbi:ATP-binding protein [Caenimonas terrae]|uniref:histidine kinase n=1 Tax=Caenimonas terrae TaxID=696074 RepID=A0ABW0NIS5_9BURK